MKLIPIQSNSPHALHAALDDLLEAVFGLSFNLWRQRGCWTEDYTVYALVEGQRVLASAGAYRMEMRVGRESRQVVQLGAVATRPECRGLGLSRRILEAVLGQYLGLPCFLFANRSVLDFYPRFGFRRLPDTLLRLRCSLKQGSGEMRPVPVDDPAVAAALAERACFSLVLDFPRAAPLHWFHYLYEYSENLYEIPDLGVVLAAERQGSTLTLMDVAARAPLTWDQIAPHLGFDGVEEICFGFNPDGLGAACQAVEVDDDAAALFVRGDLNLPPGALIPWAART